MDFRRRFRKIVYPILIAILLFIGILLSLFSLSLRLNMDFFTLVGLTFVVMFEGLLPFLELIIVGISVIVGAVSLMKRIHRGEKLSDIVFPKETKCPKCGGLKLSFKPSSSVPSPESGKRRWRVTCYDCGEKWEKEYT